MENSARLLVTGATGKVGQRLIQRILSDERFAHFQLRALCHNRPLTPGARLEVVRHTFRNYAVTSGFDKATGGYSRRVLSRR